MVSNKLKLQHVWQLYEALCYFLENQLTLSDLKGKKEIQFKMSTKQRLCKMKIRKTQFRFMDEKNIF